MSLGIWGHTRDWWVQYIDERQRQKAQAGPAHEDSMKIMARGGALIAVARMRTPAGQDATEGSEVEAK